MEIIDATWEKETLGVNTIEIKIASEDINSNSCSELLVQVNAIVDRKNAQYIVIKCPAQYANMLIPFQDDGYRYIESILSLKYDVKKNKDTLLKYTPCLSETQHIKVNNEEMIKFIIEEIKKGIFTTDRISLDSYFGIEIANLRYANWTYNEFRNGSDIYLSYKDNEPIGFSIMRTGMKGIRHSLLGGIFVGQRNMGLGMINAMLSLNNEMTLGTRWVKTAVSINNESMLHIDELLGLKMTDVTHVLIKHI